MRAANESSSPHSLVKYFFTAEKRNFVSPSGLVISSINYIASKLISQVNLTVILIPSTDVIQPTLTLK